MPKPGNSGLFSQERTCASLEGRQQCYNESSQNLAVQNASKGRMALYCFELQ